MGHVAESFELFYLLFETVQVKSQQPIVINSYKVISDSYFIINYTGAKASENCSGKGKLSRAIGRIAGQISGQALTYD
ncbi:hypothetical protein [Methanosarcina barkeri]|uniref:hypothetical protein n=1 Tax=Methanosarcina barkeri TaxID=2208 RepID=UPI0012D4A69B|nr:hypothetical protein [Methanosarcina barkeri]